MKNTLISSFLTQAYINLIGIVLMPFYMHQMGIEAFGLIGFFIMLQSWLQILDLGFSPTLSREMSLYSAGVLNAKAIWLRLRTLEYLLGSLALTTGIVITLARNWIAEDWLHFVRLSSDEVSICVVAMTVTAALRWLAGLYRAGLVGLEQQMRVNIMSAFFTTIKFVGVVPLLIYWSADPIVFFVYQALIGTLELFSFAFSIYGLLPGAPVNSFPKWVALKTMLPISGAMAFMAGMWVFLTQIDRLILSRLLPLKEYGYFTLAVVVGGGVLALIPPINQVLQPRMTILASQGLEEELSKFYRHATQLITAAFLALGGTLALFASPIIHAWTGSVQTAIATAPILYWYGLANALIGILFLPFMLQFAHGYLRLHVIGNLILGLTLIPTLVFASIRFGGTGTGATLLISNLLFLLLWVPRVHRRLMPDIVWKWPIQDVGNVAIPIIIFLVLAQWLLPSIENRFLVILEIVLTFITALFVGLLSGKNSRKMLTNWVKSIT